MASGSDLLGLLITGARDVFVAKESGKSVNYEVEEKRAALRAAEQRTQAAQSAYQQAQDFFNSNMTKAFNFLLATVAVGLLGVIGYNVFKR